VEANSLQTAAAYGNLASTRCGLGDLAGGFELRAKAEEAAERFGLVRHLRLFDAERVVEDYWRGRWDVALRGADQFIAESEAGARDVAESGCRLVRGRIWLARGELVAVVAEEGLRLTDPDWSVSLPSCC
jgi:hypothetical protein